MYLKDKFCEKDNSIIDKDIPHICHVITTKKKHCNIFVVDCHNITEFDI